MKEKNPFLSGQSVLIIKPRAIGDVLLSTPVIRNLKQYLPGLNIDYFAEQFAVDILIGNPDIREVISYDKKNDSMPSILQRIRKKRYDVIIDLFCNPRTALLTRFSGAPHRIGFPFRGRTYAYNYLIPPRGGDVHNIDFNLDALRFFNIPIVSRDPEFPISNVHRSFADQWLTEKRLSGKKIVGINPSGGWYTKRWNRESYAHLAERIIAEEQCAILFFWGPGEKDEVTAIQSLMPSESFLIPKTSLKEMGAFLERCMYLVSNDSGPMHIAASLGVPTLGIYGPTNPHLQGPHGKNNLWIRNEALDCLECNLTACPIGNVCMKELSVDAVFQSYKLLTNNNSH